MPLEKGNLLVKQDSTCRNKEEHSIYIFIVLKAPKGMLRNMKNIEREKKEQLHHIKCFFFLRKATRIWKKDSNLKQKDKPKKNSLN